MTITRIAVVGAGVAGLAACSELRRNGFDAVLYEGSERTGGRCHSEAFGDAVIDRGAAFIDSHHSAALAFINRYHLDLVDLNAVEDLEAQPLFRVGGQSYDWDTAEREFMPLLQAIQQDYRIIQRKGGASRRSVIDRLSVADYLAELGGEFSDMAKKLLAATLQWEQAADPEDLSALALVLSLGPCEPNSFSLLGTSDTRFTLRYGMQSLTDAMTAELEPWVEVGHRLVRIRQDSSGVELTFECSGAGIRMIRVDAAVITIPFAVLRQAVDLTGAELNDMQRRAIEELGYGRSTKVHINLASNPWRGTAWNGSVIDAGGLQACWDGGQVSGTEQTILVNLTAGSSAFDGTTGAADLASRITAGIADMCSAPVDWAGAFVIDEWHNNEWTCGSYAYFRPGQWAAFSEVVCMPAGAIRFAGEHTSPYSGGVNGALRSGIVAARELGGV